MRHGHDKNEDGHMKHKYSHDPTITSLGKKEVAKATHKLVRKYGVPKVIYCSPFKRCRATVKVMLEHFHDTNKRPNVFIDNRLSKFYTESQQKNPNGRPSTMKYNPPIIECHNDVMDRCLDIYEELDGTSNRVWCVTHAIIVRYISQEIDEEIEHVEFLQKVVI